MPDFPPHLAAAAAAAHTDELIRRANLHRARRNVAAPAPPRATGWRTFRAARWVRGRQPTVSPAR